MALILGIQVHPRLLGWLAGTRYAAKTVKLIQSLDKQKGASPHRETKPWLIVSSFVNPHDIVLYGDVTRTLPLFKFAVDTSVPNIPPPPTLTESLDTKPRAQRSYRDVYALFMQPTTNNNFYRQLYFQLQKNVDQQIVKVLQALCESSFYEDTIVIFTADHGDMLGAHGGMHQKWYSAYEEIIHVPFIMHNPRLFRDRESVNLLTSHVDLLPTMLGLAGIEPGKAQANLKKNHNEVHPLVGRDLTPMILGAEMPERVAEPIYFMTDDDITKNSIQVGILGIHYEPVVQPKHIETVIAEISVNGRKEIWKYSVYFDNPQFWSSPGLHDEVQPVPNEYELYNLTADPLEVINLANPRNATQKSIELQMRMADLLEIQCRRKRLSPTSGAVPGMPTCKDIQK